MKNLAKHRFFEARDSVVAIKKREGIRRPKFFLHFKNSAPLTTTPGLTYLQENQIFSSFYDEGCEL
jgi:hypothetical protein